MAQSIALTAPRRANTLVWALIVAVIVGGGLTAYGQLYDTDDASSEIGAWLVELAAIGVAAVVTYRGAVGALTPGNASGAAKRALVFGVLALLSLPVFWLGIYAPFGAGALVSGFFSLRHGGTTGTRAMAVAGMLIGAVGIVVNALGNLFG